MVLACPRLILSDLCWAWISVFKRNSWGVQATDCFLRLFLYGKKPRLVIHQQSQSAKETMIHDLEPATLHLVAVVCRLAIS
jgi:hypothetical protein